jgi:cytoskeletal protein CcmA (bactofilin family)
MFRRKNDMVIDVSRLAGLLPHDTCVRGDITFAGGLRIDGRVEGNVLSKPESKGLLVLSEKGVVVGTVKSTTRLSMVMWKATWRSNTSSSCRPARA